MPHSPSYVALQAGEWTPVLGINPTVWLSYLHHSNPYRYGALHLHFSCLTRPWLSPLLLGGL